MVVGILHGLEILYFGVLDAQPEFLADVLEHVDFVEEVIYTPESVYVSCVAKDHFVLLYFLLYLLDFLVFIHNLFDLFFLLTNCCEILVVNILFCSDSVAHATTQNGQVGLEYEPEFDVGDVRVLGVP